MDVTEKRLALDLMTLKEHLTNGDISRITWIDTRNQVADPLTKEFTQKSVLDESIETGIWPIDYDGPNPKEGIKMSAGQTLLSTLLSVDFSQKPHDDDRMLHNSGFFDELELYSRNENGIDWNFY